MLLTERTPSTSAGTGWARPASSATSKRPAGPPSWLTTSPRSAPTGT